MTAQQGQSLGEFLRQEREKRGITIEQVASATKIAVRILHCLEADQYSELPAKPFIRGFVISYVRFIGLDSKEILTRFGSFIETKAADRPARDQGHSGYAFERRETEQSRMMLWFILGGFVAVGTILFLILKPTLHKRKSAHQKLNQAQNVAVTPAPSISPSPGLQVLPSPSPSPSIATMLTPSPTPTAAIEKFHPPAKPLVLLDVPVVSAPSASPSPAPKPSATPRTSPNDPLNSGADMPKEEIRHRVVFRAVDDVWVRFQSDDRKPMRFILRKDKILVVRAHDLIRFQASDPKSVRFSYAGMAGKLMSDERSAVMRQGDLTLVFPPQAAETVKEPFPGAKSIFMAPVPPPPAPKPSPSPSP